MTEEEAAIVKDQVARNRALPKPSDLIVVRFGAGRFITVNADGEVLEEKTDNLVMGKKGVN